MIMSTNKLHIVGSPGRPEAIKRYLDLIDRRDYESLDAVMTDAYQEFGLKHPSDEDRLIDTKDMTTTLSKLGLIESEERQQLTELGQGLVEVLIHNEDRFYDLLHFIYASTYFRDPSPDRFVSWAYYQITSELRERSPVIFNEAKQEIVEAVLETAGNTSEEGFDNHGTLSNKSIINYRRFIDRLDPPVIHDGQVELRDFVPSELVLASIDLLYRSDFAGSRNYGDLMMLDGKPAEALQTLCLVREEALTGVVEQASTLDARLKLKSDYTLHVRLSNPVEIHELA